MTFYIFHISSRPSARSSPTERYGLHALSLIHFSDIVPLANVSSMKDGYELSDLFARLQTGPYIRYRRRYFYSVYPVPLSHVLSFVLCAMVALGVRCFGGYFEHVVNWMLALTHLGWCCEKCQRHIQHLTWKCAPFRITALTHEINIIYFRDRHFNILLELLWYRSSAMR